MDKGMVGKRENVTSGFSFQVSAFEIIYHCMITIFRQGKMAVCHAVVQSRNFAERTSVRRDRRRSEKKIEKSIKMVENENVDVDESATRRRDEKRTLNFKNIFRDRKSRNDVILANGNSLKLNNLIVNSSELKSASTFSMTPSPLVENSATATTAAGTTRSLVPAPVPVADASPLTSEACSIAKDNSSTEIIVIAH